MDTCVRIGVTVPVPEEHANRRKRERRRRRGKDVTRRGVDIVVGVITTVAPVLRRRRRVHFVLLSRQICWDN